MTDGTLTLIRRTFQKDEYGVDKVILERNLDIFCKADYPTRAEYFEASRSGLRPALKFVIHPLDYNWDGKDTNPTEIEYEGKIYTVYRAYQPDADHLELYTEERIGNGK